MKRYAIYRTVDFLGKLYESLVCIAYTKEYAHEVVQSLRKQAGNQMYHFKEIM